MPIFRSSLQVQLLTWLLLHPNQEQSISDLAARMDASWPTVQREINRLVAADLLRERDIGRSRLVAANTDSPYHQPLIQILGRAFGPPSAVADAFDDMPGVDEVIIIGSWADRFLGEPGPPPRDLDVLVVGNPPRRDVRRINEELEHSLEMSVHITTVAAGEWETSRTGFLADVRTRPYLTVIRRQ